VKIEATPIVAAALTDAQLQAGTPASETTPDTAPDASSAQNDMPYEALLPYLLLPMAGAY
jgi:hypothetical protein